MTEVNHTFTDYIDAIEDSVWAVSDGNEKINYGDLRIRAGQVATYLSDRYGIGNYVIVKAPLSIDFVTTLLGVMYSGNVPIPVNPSMPKSALDFISLKSKACDAIEPLKSNLVLYLKPMHRSDATLASLVMFTSGTSGYPKGVIISHQNLLFSCQVISEYLRYREHSSAAVVLPMYYSYGLLSQVLCQLFIGGFVRLCPEFQNIFEFCRIVNELGLETFCGVPSTYMTLVKVHRLKAIKMPSIKVLCSAGAAMNRAVFEEIKQIFPNAMFFDNYGMTEASPRISYIREDDPHFHEPTCGRPMKGMEVKIVDPESYEPLSDGKEGVLAVRGPNISQGYLNDVELTAKSFTRDGFLISGDIGYMNDGYIFLRGRQDDIFNVGGEKVSPLEIERVLNKLPGIVVSAVTGIADEDRGHVPATFVILEKPVTRRQLTQALEEELVPSVIPYYYYEVRTLPMTPNGKLQRSKLSPNAEFVIREIT